MSERLSPGESRRRDRAIGAAESQADALHKKAAADVRQAAALERIATALESLAAALPGGERVDG